jgi:DNA processing protein
MDINKLTLKRVDYPERLRRIKSPPNPLFHTGAPLDELLKRPVVAVVGSRRMSPYGRQVTLRLARELTEQGIVIVSGLAFGVDATAHRAALDAGGQAIAVLPGPLDNVLPATNRRLAEQILTTGGALVSEYPPGDIPFKQNFVARNRLMAGLADAVLITEAGEKSGTRHTVRFANDQNKEVLVVPGNINSPFSAGANNFIKTNKGGLITSYKDVLNALGFQEHKTPVRQVRGGSPNEQRLLDLMLQGISAGEMLLAKSCLEISEFNRALTMLEISCKIRPLGANHWAIY